MQLSLVSRVGAGLVTPALAGGLWCIGDAALHHHPLPPVGDVFDVTRIAAVLGGPFGVAGLLLIRLRRLWFAVPILAVVAAAGIDVQLKLMSWIPEQCGICVVWGLWFWSVPALFATIAALLLSRVDRLTYRVKQLE